jgi:DNA gyrase/topoisomerase IV subunit B
MRINLPEEYGLASVPSEDETADLVRRLMGRKSKPRYHFIKKNARFAEVDV